jgi:hypothetical protein
MYGTSEDAGPEAVANEYVPADVIPSLPPPSIPAISVTGTSTIAVMECSCVRSSPFANGSPIKVPRGKPSFDAMIARP